MPPLLLFLFCWFLCACQTSCYIDLEWKAKQDYIIIINQCLPLLVIKVKQPKYDCSKELFFSYNNGECTPRACNLYAFAFDSTYLYIHDCIQQVYINTDTQISIDLVYRRHSARLPYTCIVTLMSFVLTHHSSGNLVCKRDEISWSQLSQ